MHFEPDGWRRKVEGHPCYLPEKARCGGQAGAGGAVQAAGGEAAVGRPRHQLALPPSLLSIAHTPPSLHRSPALACTSSVPQDLIMPLMKVPDHFGDSPLIGAPTRNRTYLAFHRGRVRGHSAAAAAASASASRRLLLRSRPLLPALGRAFCARRLPAVPPAPPPSTLPPCAHHLAACVVQVQMNVPRYSRGLRQRLFNVSRAENWLEAHKIVIEDWQ